MSVFNDRKSEYKHNRTVTLQITFTKNVALKKNTASCGCTSVCWEKKKRQSSLDQRKESTKGLKLRHNSMIYKQNFVECRQNHEA